MKLRSSAFEEGGAIPERFTCTGDDISPPLSWSEVPKETKSLVLIVDDPDAPGDTWVHWVMYGLSPNANKLDEQVPPEEEAGGARQGLNDFGNIGYGGPCPPPGPAHRYFFKLYAVDTDMQLPAGATKAEVLRSIEGHILEEAELVGRFGRR